MKFLLLILVCGLGSVAQAVDNTTFLISDPEILARIEAQAKTENKDDPSPPLVQALTVQAPTVTKPKKRPATAAADPTLAPPPRPDRPVAAAVATTKVPAKKTPKKKAAPPVAAQPAPPVRPAKKTAAYPRCSSRASEVQAMMQDKLGTSMFDQAGYREENPEAAALGSVRLIKDSSGTVQVKIMNGQGQVIGMVPARFCAGASTVTASLQRTGIDFGSSAGGLINNNDVIDQRLTQYQGNNKVFILDLSRTAQAGVIHVADRMTGEKADERVNGNFSPISR